MVQIINRRQASVSLATLADNAILEMDSIMEGLTHKAFLFEYRMKGMIKSLDVLDWVSEFGINIVLVKQDTSGGLINTILNGVQITDESAHIDVPTRQDVFAVADIDWASVVSTIDAYLNFELVFQPGSKGGIPFMEGSGWEVVVINRTGAALSTGNLLFGNVYERFAYEGGN